LVYFHRPDLNDLAVKLSDSKEGSAAYLGCYRKAIKTVEEGLDEETQLKYRALAKKWSEDQPPIDEQRRYAL
jgi:hypothetical protein